MGSKKRRIRHADTKQLDKDDEEHSIKSYVIQQLNKFFVQHLPMESLKEFPPSYMYYAGTVAYMVMIATFVYFTFQSYLSSVQQAFIALDSSSGDCTSVPIAISNSYLADTRGNWVGTPHFTYSLASYSLTLNNFQAGSFDDYETMMNTFHTSLDHIGEVSVNHSLAYNLVLWTSWIRYYSTADPTTVNFTSQGLGQLQYMQMTGQPAVIFNANRHQAVISSQYGLCGVVGYTSYDMANARVMTQVNYTYYSAQPLCMVALQPQLFGYIASVDNNIFSYGLDVNAFVTAMAVNYGILRLEDLGVASQTVYRLTVDGNAYVGQQYFDLRYPYMSPILCVRNTTALPSGAGVLLQRLCFVLESEAVTLPLYDHFGLSYRYPIPCRCGAANQNAGSLPPCQVFNMLASLLYYVPTKGTTSIQELIIDQLENLLQIVYGYESYSDFTLKGFNASWSAAAEAYGRRASETLSPTWQKNAFGFCALPSGKRCSLMTFNSYNAINRIVSEYKYQLSNGSCANTFTIPDEDWNRLMSTAPAQLTQDYYDCYPTASNAFFNALGIASGNTQLAVPLTVLVTIPFIYLFLVLIQQVPPKEEYTALEKEEVMEIVSIILLRLRDGKTRGFKKNGVLVKLTKELIKAAKEDVGYPDSDDDDEEDSDAEPEAIDDDDGEEEEDGEGEEDGEEDEDEGEGGGQTKRTTVQTKAVTIDSDDEIVESPPSTTEGTAASTTKKTTTKTKTQKNVAQKKTKKASAATTSTAKRRRRTSALPVDYDPWQTSEFKPKKASKLSVFTRQLEDDTGGSGVGGQRRRPTAAGGDDGQGPGGDDAGYYPGKYLISTARLMRDNVQRQAHQQVVARHRTKHRPVDGDSDDDEGDDGHAGQSAKRSKQKKATKTTSKATSSAYAEDPSRFSVTDGATEMTVFGQGPSNATGTATGRTLATSSSSSSNPMHDDVETGAVRARKAPKLVFRIIAHEGIPHDCMILNALDRGQVQHISRKPIKDFKPLVQLLDDLSKQANVTFTDYDTNPRGYEVTEDLRRPETSLFHLTALSMRLLFVEFDYFLRLTSSSASSSSTVTVEDVTMVMVKLSNILRLHASVMLQISLKDMETYNYVGKVGYNLGGRYVTVPHLLQLMAALSEGGPA